MHSEQKTEIQPGNVLGESLSNRVFRPAGNVIAGWSCDRGGPARFRDVVIMKETKAAGLEKLALVNANHNIAWHGIGKAEAAHSFIYRVPLPAEACKIRVFDAELGFELDGSPIHFGVAPRLEGYLDGVVDGRVVGWAWGTAPQYHCEIDVYVDGEFVKTIFAIEWRPDLAPAGVGNGDFGFSYAIPDQFLDGAEHEVSCFFHGTNIELGGNPARFRLRRFSSDVSLGRDGVLRGVLSPTGIAEDERLNVVLLLDGQPISEFVANREAVVQNEAIRHSYTFSVPALLEAGTFEILVRGKGEDRYPVDLLEALRPLAPATCRHLDAAEEQERIKLFVDSGRHTVKLLIAAWGEAYIRNFCELALPSLLAEGNLPALAAAHDLEVVLLVRASEIARFEKFSSYKALACRFHVNFISIDDVLAESFDRLPDKTYAVALTKAFFRGIKHFSDDALSIDFIFWNADFIAADGAFRRLSEVIARGGRCTMASSLRVDDAARPIVSQYLNDNGDELRIGPRDFVRLALDHLHPTVKAKTINQYKNITMDNINQFYWKAEGDVLLCRSFILFMLHIRPERIWDDVNGFCDYAFIPEMVPNSDIVYECDSDNICIIEFQEASKESEYVRLREIDIPSAARSIDYWATHQHIESSKELVIFNGNMNPASADYGIATAAQPLDAFMHRLYERLGPVRQWHNEHVYWRLSFQLLGHDDAPQAGWDRPRSRAANLAFWTGYDLDLLRESWGAVPPVNLVDLFESCRTLNQSEPGQMSKWLDDLFDTYVGAWRLSPTIRVIDQSYIELASVRRSSQQHWVDFHCDFAGARWGGLEKLQSNWYRMLGPGGRSIILHRVTQRTGYGLRFEGVARGARKAGDLVVMINGRPPCGRTNRQDGERFSVTVFVDLRDVAKSEGRLIIDIVDSQAGDDTMVPRFGFAGYHIFPHDSAGSDVDLLLATDAAADDASWDCDGPFPPKLPLLRHMAVVEQPTDHYRVEFGKVFTGIGWRGIFTKGGRRFRWTTCDSTQAVVLRLSELHDYRLELKADRGLSNAEMAVSCEISVNGRLLPETTVVADAASYSIMGDLPQAIVGEYGGWVLITFISTGRDDCVGAGRIEFGEPDKGGLALSALEISRTELPIPESSPHEFGPSPRQDGGASDKTKPYPRMPLARRKVQSNPLPYFWGEQVRSLLDAHSRAESVREQSCRRLGVCYAWYMEAVRGYRGRVLAAWVSVPPSAAHDDQQARVWLAGVDREIEAAWKATFSAQLASGFRFLAIDGLVGSGFGQLAQETNHFGRFVAPSHPTKLFLKLDKEKSYDIQVSCAEARFGLAVEALEIRVNDWIVRTLTVCRHHDITEIGFHIHRHWLVETGGCARIQVGRRDAAAPNDKICIVSVSGNESSVIPDEDDAGAVKAAPATAHNKTGSANFSIAAERFGVDPIPYLEFSKENPRVADIIGECPDLWPDDNWARTRAAFQYMNYVMATECKFAMVAPEERYTVNLLRGFLGTSWGMTCAFNGLPGRHVSRDVGEATIFVRAPTVGGADVVIHGVATVPSVQENAVVVAVNGLEFDADFDVIDETRFRLGFSIPAERLSELSGLMAIRIRVARPSIDAVGFHAVEFRWSADGAADERGSGTKPAAGNSTFAAAAGHAFPQDLAAASQLGFIPDQEIVLAAFGRDPLLYRSQMWTDDARPRRVWDSCPSAAERSSKAALRWLDLLDRAFIESALARQVSPAALIASARGDLIPLGWGPVKRNEGGAIVRTLSGVGDAMIVMPPRPNGSCYVDIYFDKPRRKDTIMRLNAVANRRSEVKKTLTFLPGGPRLRLDLDEAITEFGGGWTTIRLFTEYSGEDRVGVSFRSNHEPDGREILAVRNVEVVDADGQEIIGCGSENPGTGLATKVLPASIHVCVPMWGEKYIKTFLSVCLPAHLAPGNIPSLSDVPVYYEIFTDEAGRKAVEGHPLYPKLCAAVADVIFFDIRSFRYEERAFHPLVLNYSVMNKCHHASIKRAFADKGALLFLNCDTVYSDGVFRRLWTLVCQGYRAIENLSIRTDRDEMLPALTEHLSNDGLLRLGSEQLTQIALRRLHWIAKGRFWNGSPDLTIPDNLYWWVSEKAIVARATHFMPLFVFPRTPDLSYEGTIDHAFVPASGIMENERWLMRVADEPSSYELSLPAHDQHFMPFERGSVRDLARFLGLLCEHHHIWNLMRPVRLGGEDVPEERWQEVERESGAVLESIRHRLRRYALQSWRPDDATEAEEVA